MAIEITRTVNIQISLGYNIVGPIPGDMNMDSVVNFFTLRPTFTFVGLKIVWYIYLLNVIIQTYTGVSGISRLLAQRGISMEVWLPNSLPLFLGIIAQLAIVRVLIEVAAIIISTSQTGRDA